jgi:hypothetical protein
MTDDRQRPKRIDLPGFLTVAVIVLTSSLGCRNSAMENLAASNAADDQSELRNRVWDGYYTAAFNHRYCLRLAAQHPDEAEQARKWRQLQSSWRPLRYHSAPDLKRVELLEQQQDRLEEAEDPTHYDDKLASEVQAELDRFLGAKR